MKLLRKLRAVFRKEAVEAEMVDELRAHLELQTQQNIARGMTPEAARSSALRSFGGMEQIKEHCRDEQRRGWLWLEQFFTDLRRGCRQLRRAPGFAAVATLTLALAIGAPTAVFSVVYAVVLRPLPFPDSERLVALWTHTPEVERLPMGAADAGDLRAQAAVFEDIALLRKLASYNLTGEGEPERLSGARIASNLLRVLRVEPAVGRGFTSEECEPGRDRVVILSDGLWRRRYASSPEVLGKTIRLEGVAHTVVGVMGPEFRYPSSDTQLWTPLTINPADFQTRTGYGHLAVARLVPGATLEQAQRRVDAIAARLARTYPQPNQNVRFDVAVLRADIGQVARRPLLVLLGAALGLLLIGCCNLVNLLLARALSRGRETALRSALGASRSRLARQVVAELLPLLGLGAIAGVVLAKWGAAAAIPWLPAGLPRVEEIAVSWPVLGFSAVLLLTAGVAVIVLPALQTARSELAGPIAQDARTASGGPARAALRKLLIVGQVALTVMLLAASGLLIRTFAELKEVDPGFKPRGVLSLRLAIPNQIYRGDAAVAAFCQRILDRVRALPGVEAAGMGNRLPLAGASGLSTIEFERADETPGSLDATDETTVTPDYFRAIGIPLRAGRSFTERDAANATPVAIVDEGVAGRAWPGENPIGKRLRSGPGAPWAEVVGVVGHVRHESLDQDRRSQVYWNYLQRARDRVTLFVRATGDARALAKPVLAAINAVDPDQPAFAVRTMTEVLDESLAVRRFNAVTVSLFGGAALLLAMVGIYGVMAWTVQQRTREIGVRMALGAPRGAVLALILSNGCKLVGAGVGLGLLGAGMSSHVLHGLLFGVRPIDPLTFTCVPLLLLATALLACWLPARRAVKIDPMIALRAE